MQELINYLLTTPYAQYITLLIFIMFIFQQILPHLPPSVTSKIPNWVMLIVNSLAGRYKNAANKKTDIKGNVK